MNIITLCSYSDIIITSLIEIIYLINLESLFFFDHICIPTEIGYLINLSYLNTGDILYLPLEIGILTSLKIIQLNMSSLLHLPIEICNQIHYNNLELISTNINDGNDIIRIFISKMNMKCVEFDKILTFDLYGYDIFIDNKSIQFRDSEYLEYPFSKVLFIYLNY